MRVKRGLKGQGEERKLVEGHTGHLDERCGAGLHVGDPETVHTWCLRAWEA